MSLALDASVQRRDASSSISAISSVSVTGWRGRVVGIENSVTPSATPRTPPPHVAVSSGSDRVCFSRSAVMSTVMSGMWIGERSVADERLSVIPASPSCESQWHPRSARQHLRSHSPPVPDGQRPWAVVGAERQSACLLSSWPVRAAHDSGTERIMWGRGDAPWMMSAAAHAA